VDRSTRAWQVHRSGLNWITRMTSQPWRSWRGRRRVRRGDRCVRRRCLVFGEGRTPLAQTNRKLKPELLIQGAAGARLQQPALWFAALPRASCGGLDATFHFFFDVELAIRYLAMFPAFGIAMPCWRASIPLRVEERSDAEGVSTASTFARWRRPGTRPAPSRSGATPPDAWRNLTAIGSWLAFSATQHALAGGG